MTTGWQPIETAPKDGTWILVGADGFRVIYVSWRSDAWRYPYSLRKLMAYQPTHWMPLPPPPPEAKD